ncbi:hypothetical protein [Sphingomonas xinjiangensis]|uniref:Uncharacterized protein n=1 Tax=Sphingomonas xinjiangensis TaxID=643568 RepID=A0A840YP16_9SPHN|nr:hypothetical protein [Sphingomonas xinjiangensis]MBB5709761.1 hypothetical protein [Sphingomonas xinjiangensis]
MDIIKLPIGQAAAGNVDCIRIQELPDGQFELNGSVLLQCGDSDVAESVAMVGSEPYRSADAAESAGMAWAADHCVEQLHVARSDGTKPLPDPA